MWTCSASKKSGTKATARAPSARSIARSAEIILCEDPDRKDRGRLFVSLTHDGIAQLRRELVERSIPSKESWWGYDVIQIDDPDGNGELLFPITDE